MVSKNFSQYECSYLNDNCNNKCIRDQDTFEILTITLNIKSDEVKNRSAACIKDIIMQPVNTLMKVPNLGK